jgi:hypothetical protein
LKGVRTGKNLERAAKSAHVAPERLRVYMRQTGVVEKQRGRWRVVEDHRRREMTFYSQGDVVTVMLPGYEPAAKVGRYLSAVSQFLTSNDPADLGPFAGDGVTDVRGRFHSFETRPNVLYLRTSLSNCRVKSGVDGYDRRRNEETVHTLPPRNSGTAVRHVPRI